MADEATTITLFGTPRGRPIRYLVQDATAIPKGSLLELDADMRVIVATNTDKCFVGIAAFEKVANDGTTYVTAYTDGIFDILSDAGADVRGAVMMISAATNTIETADAAGLLAGGVVGYYLESGTNGGREAVRVNK